MRIKIDKNLVTYEEQDELIIINMKENHFLSLDFIGTEFWKEINKYKHVKKVIKEISCKYSEVDRNLIEKDVYDFVNRLVDERVIKIV